MNEPQPETSPAPSRPALKLQPSGTRGSAYSFPSRMERPSSSRVTTRKYQPAEPVYQLQPAWPSLSGFE